MARHGAATWPGVIAAVLAAPLVAAGPVVSAPAGPSPGPMLAARLGLLVALVALHAGLARRLVLGGPRPGRHWTALILLPALSTVAAQAAVIYGEVPLGAAPLALGALLAGLTLGRPAALLTAAAAVLMLGVGQGAAPVALWPLAAGTLLSALLVWPRRLATLVPAGLAGAALQAGLALAGLQASPGPDVSREVGLALSAAGPAAAAVAALVLAPFLLLWTGTTSAWRLRRWSHPGFPLQAELRRRATGTFRHCLNVARLAEAAGEALGGDRLLLRAAACYHDLGKLVGPEHFEENDLEGPDPLAARSPEDAALRLRRHVRDGLRLARRYRLPRELRPFIAEHHGTGEVRGPATRARREGRTLDPAVYHYTGPLPRSRESAILMVCDAVEAASRRLDDPSLAAVSGVVEEVVDRLMTEYQFEDCDVSQVDLLTLQEVLVHTLRQGLHRRRPAPATETR